MGEVGHCKWSVPSRKVPGVTKVYVNPATETAYIHCDAMGYDPARIVAAIQGTGFRAGPLRTQ